MQEPKNVPKESGVYIYKDSLGKVLYVGKAKKLSSRVKQYFSLDASAKAKELVSKAKSIEFIVTKNEGEALVLEYNLIRQFQPYFNVMLKEGTEYAYLKITSDDFPRLLTVRKRELKKGEKIYGPFPSGSGRIAIKRFLEHTFKIRTCNTLPKVACLQYHLGYCKAPCAGFQSKEDYLQAIKSAKEFLEGNTSALIKDLEKKMLVSSKKREYEKALEYKRQINSVKLDSQSQVVDTQAGFDEDVIGVASKYDLFCANVFSLKQGVVQARDYYKIEALDEENFLPNFLLQYYQTHYPPSKIIVAKEFPGLSELSDILSKKYSKSVLVKQASVKREKELIELAEKNSQVQLGLSGSTQEVLELQKQLGLTTAPKTIECFDVSHLGGTNTVASMVQFVDGKPNKSSYRKFNIKTVKGIDDFACMNEVVYRRYSRLKAEGKQFPDLVVVDGGAGQLSAAIKALEKAGVDLPLIALAKKLEQVFQPDKNDAIVLPKNSRGLRLLQALRDEAHRFAISFQRKKRRLLV